MSQPANDDFSQHLSDDEASYLEDASDNGIATNKPKQQQQLIPITTTISNIKLPILKKEEYDIWAMEMEHYLEYINNDVWSKFKWKSKKKSHTEQIVLVRGPQKPEISDSDDKSNEHSTCQSNDCEGSFGNPSKHFSESESETISVPKEMSTSKSVTTNEKGNWGTAVKTSADHPLKNMEEQREVPKNKQPVLYLSSGIVQLILNMMPDQDDSDMQSSTILTTSEKGF
ncbi:hypothetical protein Tco_0553161 [Tanacetum coccineum]